MSIVSTTKMTARQFIALGDDPPGIRLELVNGEVAVSPSPTPEHGYVLIQLASLLNQYVKSQRLGRVYSDIDTILDIFNVRRPDILYFANHKLHLIGKTAMEGPPDLCVEIVSPSSVSIDRKDKFKQYRDADVPFYWIADPKRRTFDGFELSRGKYHPAGSGKGDDLLKLPPFPKLNIPLKDLWHPD